MVNVDLRPKAVLDPANHSRMSSKVVDEPAWVLYHEMDYYQGLGAVSCESGADSHILEDKQNVCSSSCILRCFLRAGPTYSRHFKSHTQEQGSHWSEFRHARHYGKRQEEARALTPSSL